MIQEKMKRERYSHIDLSKWQQVGEGGNGKTYENPSRPDVILKLNNSRLSTIEAVRHEYNVSKAIGALKYRQHSRPSTNMSVQNAVRLLRSS